MTTLEGLRKILTDAGNVPNARLTPITVKLFKNDVTPTPATVLADLEEADFSGYLNQHPETVGSVWDDAANNAIVSYAGLHFGPSDALVPNVIFGYYLVGETAPIVGILMAVVRFPTPVNLAGPFDALDFVPTFKIGPPTDL